MNSRYLHREDLDYELKVIIELAVNLLDVVGRDETVHKRYAAEKANLIKIYAEGILAKCEVEDNEE